MDSIDPKEYCSKKPDFPPNAYIAYFFYGRDGKILIFPLYQIYNEIEDVDNAMNELIEDLKKQKSTINIPEEIIVVPIKFDKEIPLVRKYWEGEHQNYSIDERIHLFLQLLDKPDFYQLFVLPTTYNKELDVFKLVGVLPVKKGSAALREAVNFLQNSDYNVDERASASALYNLGKPMRYNWATKKIDYPEKPSDAIEKELIN